jgi:hypothetical protein
VIGWSRPSERERNFCRARKFPTSGFGLGCFETFKKFQETSNESSPAHTQIPYKTPNFQLKKSTIFSRKLLLTGALGGSVRVFIKGVGSFEELPGKFHTGT